MSSVLGAAALAAILLLSLQKCELIPVNKAKTHLGKIMNTVFSLEWRISQLYKAELIKIFLLIRDVPIVVLILFFKCFLS